MIKGLDNEVRRITAYKSPFKPADLKRIGYEEIGQLCYIANSPIKNNYKGGKLK